MKYAVNFAACLVATLLMTSCGTGKKLQEAIAQNTQLAGELSASNSKLADAEKAMVQLKEQNLEFGKEAKDCRELKADVTERLEVIKAGFKKQGTSVHDILKRTQDAMQKLTDAGATVTYKAGLVYVSMPDKFLFKTGSSVVGAAGKDGLSTIAEVLQSNPRVKAIIVGNTDSTHIKGIADNWSLSTERANAVVRVLRDNYKIEPARLTAAGRGKYNPVADNTTAEGREKNRRIEIILNPDFAGLWEMIDQ